MMRDKLHNRGGDGMCEACGEPFPCAASIAARDISHLVVPTPAVHARDFENQLRHIHAALAAFQRDLNNYGRQSRRERARRDRIALAMEHLQAAIGALELAGRE